MRELDLIPASYKERLKIKKICRMFGFGFVLVLIFLFVLKFIFSFKIREYNAEIESLQKEKLLFSEQSQLYNDLLIEENKLSKYLEILKGLRGGPPVKQIMLAIDRVINADIWFTRWSFHRIGEITESPQNDIQTGYIIIIPREASASSQQQTWKLSTHMEISGQAKDHSSLSRFIERLINQPEIQDVKVINTNARDYTAGQVVSFNIVVTINNRFEDGHV